jgi:ABC-type phosphate/phosphonate transport system substrate-binding protein
MASLQSGRPAIAGSACRLPTDWTIALRHAAPALAALVALAFAVLALAPGARSAAAGEPSYGYRFGVFPYLPVLTIDQLFGPMAVSFAEVLERPVYLKTKSTFEKFADELASQTYDIVLVHPLFYVEAAEKYHYRPVARVNQKLTAVAMVAAERPWGSWRDLAGRTLALPPELSAVSQLVKGALIDVGLWPDVDLTTRHYVTKMACLQAVVMGSADACVVPRIVLAQIESIAEMKLRVMAETAPVNHFVIAVHERVPEDDRTKLLAGILAWPDSPEGQAILATGAWPGFVVAEDAEYDEIRRYRSRLHTLAQR